MKSKKYTVTKNNTERLLVTIWSWVLSMPENEININDDFFDLGGDSIKVDILRRKIKAEMGSEISLNDLHQYRSILALSEFLKTNKKCATSATRC